MSNSVGHWITCHWIVLILITSLSYPLLRMNMDPRTHLYVELTLCSIIRIFGSCNYEFVYSNTIDNVLL